MSIDTIQEKILYFLKEEQDYVSGEEISHHLKVSRQALWKHIQELKDMGYEIVAVPHLGYRLVACPDRFFPSEISYQLNTKFMGKKIYYFDVVSSTMDVALKLGLEAEPEGTVVLAEAQTKGRGRLRRSWSSPKYKGIYISLILRPKILLSQLPILTLISSVGLCEAIKEFTEIKTSIKWPNDILIDNKKLGGILTEISAETDELHFAVIGIGINVNNDKKSLVEGATSLKEKRKENVSRIELLKEILRKIESNYLLFRESGGLPIIEKWRNFNITLGRRVKIICQNKQLEGQAQDIDTDGGLLIRNDLGLVQKVMAGDVLHLR